jgi:hypothetical protein
MPRRPSGERRKKGRKGKPAAAVEEPMQTTTIALDADTHRRLRHLAIEEGTTFRELIREAIGELLTRRGGK